VDEGSDGEEVKMAPFVRIGFGTTLCLLLLLAACGGGGGGDASGEGGADGASSASCVAQVQAVIDGGCTRCWPAGLVMCTQGNADAVVGMLHCLTNNTCWDEGDYNTAGPCMQQVISTYGDSNVTAVENAINALSGCPSEYALTFTAVAAEMNGADRASFATCIGAITSCADPTAFQSCLNATHYDQSLCQN
jgi:hypothetical protein